MNKDIVNTCETSNCIEKLTKTNKIKSLKKELRQRRIQMDMDEKHIKSLKLNIDGLKENIRNIHSDMENMGKGIQITQCGLINIMSNFNEMFPDYSVDIT